MIGIIYMEIVIIWRQVFKKSGGKNFIVLTENFIDDNFRFEWLKIQYRTNNE